MATFLVRLCVFTMPSPMEAVWRGALCDAATTAGWQIVTYPLSQPLPETEDVLVLSSDVMPDMGHCSETIAIISSAGAVEQFLRELGFAEHDALRRTAEFLAYASEVSARGGSLVEASQAVAHLPGLGTVRRTLVPFPPPPAPNPALDVYREFPPAAGAVSNWAPHLFAYSVGREEMSYSRGSVVDLAGRARMLVFGPQIKLPTGEWEVEAVFVIDPEVSVAHLTISWGTAEDRATSALSTTQAGTYRAQLRKTWPAAAEAELKVESSRPHFSGSLELLRVAVRRL